jgi:hypothetical protein
MWTQRAEVAIAAERLGATVRECEYDESGATEVRSYNVLNVPAVAIEGRPDSLVVGALDAEELTERLRPFI